MFIVSDGQGAEDHPKAYMQSHTFVQVDPPYDMCRLCAPLDTGPIRCNRCGRCENCGKRIFCKGAERAESDSATGHVNRLSERMDRAIWEAFRNRDSIHPDTFFLPILALIKYANQNVNFGRKSKNETVLMAAAYAGNYDIAKELLELKADPNVETHDGYTAWTFATKYNHPKIVDLLENPKAHGVKADVPPLLKKVLMGGTAAAPNNPSLPQLPMIPDLADPQAATAPDGGSTPYPNAPAPVNTTDENPSSSNNNNNPGGGDPSSSLPNDVMSEDDAVVRLSHPQMAGPAYR